MQKPLPHKSTPNWRTHDNNFVPEGSIDTIEPGAITFSGGWFGQGHAVRYPFLNKTGNDLTSN